MFVWFQKPNTMQWFNGLHTCSCTSERGHLQPQQRARSLQHSSVTTAQICNKWIQSCKCRLITAVSEFKHHSVCVFGDHKSERQKVRTQANTQKELRFMKLKSKSITEHLKRKKWKGFPENWGSGGSRLHPKPAQISLRWMCSKTPSAGESGIDVSSTLCKKVNRFPKCEPTGELESVHATQSWEEA